MSDENKTPETEPALTGAATTPTEPSAEAREALETKAENKPKSKTPEPRFSAAAETAGKDFDDDDDEGETPDELTLLKQRAAQMGVRHSPNIGVDALRKKINAALNDDKIVDGDEEDEDGEAPKVTEVERKAALRRKQKREQLRLVRVRIACLNPAKKDWPGEVFCAGNKYIGIVKKMIPFGEVTEEGYHIPYILYTTMKNRKFLQVKTRQNRETGNIDVSQRWVPEFALDVLPMLTRAELDKLAAAQAAAGSVR